MAGRGPAGSARRSRPRDEARRQAETTQVSADGRVRGPQLPKDVLPAGEEWHPRTKAWWDTWRRSAQSQSFTATDWDFLIDTALMHSTMWSKGKWEFAAELRLRAAKFGATPEDRMRLKLQVEPPSKRRPPAVAPDEASVTDIASRRARLTG